MSMQVNALVMNASDNVAVCTEPVKQGGTVCYRRKDAVEELTAGEDIPVWHKVALTDLEEGASVIKYGEAIGVTACRIPAGGWISHTNLIGLPRNYDDEICE